MRWYRALASSLQNGRRAWLGGWVVVCAVVASCCARLGEAADQVGGPTQPFIAAPVANPDKEKTTPDNEKSTPVEGSPSAPSQSAPATQHSTALNTTPEIFYLKDKDGKLQPVPGFSLEDFVKLYRLQQQLEKPEEPKPRFSIQDIAIKGDVRGERADLTVTFRVKPQTNDWVRIPLRLTKGVLRESAEYKGDGEQFLEYDEATGYVAWLRAKEGTEHLFTLQVSATVSVSRSGSRLDLSLPRAPTSQMMLKVPMPRAAGTVSEGATLSSVKAMGNTSELNILGAAGEFHVTWRERDAPAQEIPVTLEAVGALAVKIDERQITTDANFTLRSLGGEFDHVQFRLPLTVRVLPTNSPGYKLSTEVTEETTLVHVTFDKKTTGPLDVRFTVEQDYDVSKSADPLELASIETVGAQRQFGHLAVQVPPDWQLMLGNLQGVRQVDDLPDVLRKKGAVAGFEYFRGAGQVSAFPVRVAKRKTRLHIEPEYIFSVAADHLELEGKLKCTIRGAKVARLEMEGGDWEMSEVGPASLVDVESAVANDAGRWQIPFLSPQSGEVEVTFRAQHKLAAGAAKVDWTLPKPQADVLGPAVVVILPDDNVEVTPRPEDLLGLSRQTTLPAGLKLPERQQSPLVFRGERSQARFVADLQIHPQSISAAVKSEIATNYASIRVEQKTQFQIRYVPADHLSLMVPKSLATNGSLEWYWNEQKLTPSPAREGSDPNTNLISFLLPKPTLGRGELLVRYSVPTEKLLPDTAVPATIPLPLPAEGELVLHELTITPAAGIHAELRDDSWTPVEDALPRSASRVTRYTSAQHDLQADMVLSPDESRGREREVVERAWVQTWLTSTQRQDRAAFQIRSLGGPMRLILPTGVVQSDVEVLLDEQQIPPVASPEEGLTVEIPLTRELTQHHLEIRYRFADRRSGKGSQAMELPHFAKTWVRRSYWQLILPKDEHLLTSPNEWTSENVWGWRGFFWERTTALEQVQLETWCGAGHQAAPPDQTNRYLFSNLETPGSVNLFTAGRTMLVGTASCVALILGLTLLYVPSVRRPATALVGGIALLVVGLIYPETAWLLAQASGVGMILAVVAVLLRKNSVTPIERTLIVRHFSPSALHHSATEVHGVRTAQPTGHASTATAPLTAPEVPS